MPTAQFKGNSLLAFPDDYTVVDIETTGTSSAASEIIEIGALCVRNNEIADEFSKLIKPYRPIPLYITNLTGITNADVENADPIERVLPELLRFAGGDIIVGHNVSFDMNFIRDRAEYFGQSFGNDFVDTLRLSRKYNRGLSSHKLSVLAEYYGITNDDAHRALSDCLTTHRIFQEIKKSFNC